VTTGLLAAELLAGAAIDLGHTRYSMGILARLGYPEYLLNILGTCKLLAVPALLAPGWGRLKEWAYAGVVFNMTGALASHAFCHEYSAMTAPVVFTLLAGLSWWLRPASRLCGARAEVAHARG
jgi:hypothetical protein